MNIATVENTIQTVNSSMYNAYMGYIMMGTPGNTAKPRTIHSNMQTAQSNRVPGWVRTCNALVYIHKNEEFC